MAPMFQTVIEDDASLVPTQLAAPVTVGRGNPRRRKNDLDHAPPKPKSARQASRSSAKAGQGIRRLKTSRIHRKIKEGVES